MENSAMSDNMKALQKRYIPANIFVAIVAFIAAISLLLMPIFEMSVHIDGAKLAPVVESALNSADNGTANGAQPTAYSESVSAGEEDGASSNGVDLDVGKLVASAIQGLDVTISVKLDAVKLFAAGTGTEADVVAFFNSIVADGNVGDMINDIINENMPSVMTNVISSTVTNTLKELQKQQQENAANNPDAFVLTDAQIEKVGEYIASYEEDFNTVFQNLSENKTEEAKEAFSALVNDVVTELPEKLKEEFPELGENADEGISGVVESIPEEKINAVFDAVVKNAQDEDGNFNWLNLFANMEQLQEDISNAVNEEDSDGDSSTGAPIRPMSLRYAAENSSDGQEEASTGNEQLDQVMAVLENPGAYLLGMLREQLTLEEIQTGCLGVWGTMVGFPAALWALLGICALLRLFMRKKRVKTWYVKLFCPWVGIFFLAMSSALSSAPTALVGVVGAEMILSALEALTITLLGSGLVAGICWLVLVVSGWLWYNRIKKAEKEQAYRI